MLVVPLSRPAFAELAHRLAGTRLMRDGGVEVGHVRFVPADPMAPTVREAVAHLLHHGPPLTVAQIAAQLGLPAQPVYRAIVQLEAAEIVARYGRAPGRGMRPYLWGRR